MRLFIIDARFFLGLGLNFMSSMAENFNDLSGWDDLLKEAELCWRRGGADGVESAVAICDEALRRAAKVEATEARAKVWLRRGQILESGRSPEQLHEARSSFEAGLAVLADDADAGGADVAGGERSRLRALLWMNRGNALLATGRAEEAREALRSYDEALAIAGAIRRDVGQAGADRNEGGSGGVVELDAMIGAAWLNRAEAARLANAGEAGWIEQGRCLGLAVEALSAAAGAGHAPARRNLAGAWLNRAAWHDAAGESAAARDVWREAARAAAELAREDLVALETGLRASHALCVAQARRIAAGEALDPAERAELSERVEQGLAAFASWGAAASATTAAPVASRLFEFGAWWCGRAAPGRLPEFLRRWAGDSDEARLEIGRVAAEYARQEILRFGFEELSGDRGEERRARLRELGALVELFAERQEACRQARRAR